MKNSCQSLPFIAEVLIFSAFRRDYMQKNTNFVQL